MYLTVRNEFRLEQEQAVSVPCPKILNEGDLILNYFSISQQSSSSKDGIKPWTKPAIERQCPETAICYLPFRHEWKTKGTSRKPLFYNRGGCLRLDSHPQLARPVVVDNRVGASEEPNMLAH
jgi:hypothetical protein